MEISFVEQLNKIKANKDIRSILGNTFSLIGARGLGILIRSINFIFIARNLGTEKFGIYASTIAILVIIFPLASYGAPLLLVQRHSEKYGFLHLTRFFRLILYTAGFWYMATFVASYIVLPTYSNQILLMVILLFISEVILMTVHEIFFAMFQAADKIYLSVSYSVAHQAVRLAFNLFLIIFGYFSLITFAIGQVIASAIVLIFFWRGVRKNVCEHFDGNIKKLPRLKEDLKLGMYFSFSMLSKTIYSDIDKTMLPRLASLSSAGMYSAAYRIMGMAFAPLISFFTVMFPRFFKVGASGKKSILHFVTRIYPWTIGYGLLATLFLFFLAPIVPYFLGHEYAEASTILRWLAPVLVLQGIYYPLADALTGLRQQSLRTKIQIAVLLLNIILNLILIPKIGWLGAAITTLVSEIILVIAMFGSLMLLSESKKGSIYFI